MDITIVIGSATGITIEIVIVNEIGMANSIGMDTAILIRNSVGIAITITEIPIASE
jgi:hypothetical protein